MIGRFDTILWDIDGTLLDFESTEKICLAKGVERYGYQLSQEMMDSYRKINAGYWLALEKKEVTAEYLYVHRFMDWFALEGIENIDPSQFNDAYQVDLGNTAIMYPDTLEVLQVCKGKVKQYVITNGSIVAQRIKLEKTGIGAFMEKIFISEEIGVSKPDPKFFDIVKQNIPNFHPDTCIVIGDSLSSDIKGAYLAGLPSIWMSEHEIDMDKKVEYHAHVKTLTEALKVMENL